MSYQLKIRKSLIYELILILSFLNATLRLNPDSFLSAFRVVIPIIYLFLYLPKINGYLKETRVLIIIFVWNITTSLVFYGQIIGFLSFYFHILSIFAVYIVLKNYHRVDKKFNEHVYSLLDKVTTITIILFLFQFIFRFQFPNTVPGRLSLYYWTENELGMALAIMIPIYAINLNNRPKRNILPKIIAVFMILFINDNKVSIIGLVLAFAVQLLIPNIKVIKEKRAYLFGLIMVLVALLLGANLWNPNLTFVGYSIELRELVFEPIERIIMLNPYNLAGSVYDRTDAIIYGIMELKRSFFLGIGLGNANEMLKIPQYTLVTAKSMHNFFAQIIVELGLLGIYMIYYVGKKTINGLVYDSTQKINRLRLIYFVSFPIIAMQSSAGIFSNYFVWATLIYVVIYKKETIRENENFRNNKATQ